LELELGSVEFKAMPSGSHAVSHDFSYYAVTDDTYGISVVQEEGGLIEGMKERRRETKERPLISPSSLSLFDFIRCELL
jgi:hypothetical protein